MIDLGVIVQALIVAGVTAAVTSYVNSKVTDKTVVAVIATHLKDLTDRIVRIETYLNGLLKGRK